MGLGQAQAARIVGPSLTKIDAQYARATVGGVEYFPAARGTNGVVSAIGICANGATFRTALKRGERGFEVFR